MANPRVDFRVDPEFQALLRQAGIEASPEKVDSTHVKLFLIKKLKNGAGGATGATSSDQDQDQARGATGTNGTSGQYLRLIRDLVAACEFYDQFLTTYTPQEALLDVTDAERARLEEVYAILDKAAEVLPRE